MNANQKFVEFIEKKVIVHVQFKLKSKQMTESETKIHREALVKAIAQMRIMRGVNLEGLFSGLLDI